MQPLLSPKEVAEYCGLSYRTIIRAIEDGDLPATKLRGRLRITDKDLQVWVDKGRQDSQPRPSWIREQTIA